MKINLGLRKGRLVPLDEDAYNKIQSLQEGDYYQIDLKNLDKRTDKQNRSLWLWCSNIAKSLNDNNMPISKMLEMKVEWNKDSVKAILFNPIMEATCNKKSTTKLVKEDLNKIIDGLVQVFANYGLVLPIFPNKEDFEENKNKKG